MASEPSPDDAKEEGEADESKISQNPHPKKRKSRKSKFVDEECQESKPRHKKERKQKKVKTKEAERRKMRAAQKEIPILLQNLFDPENGPGGMPVDTHYYMDRTEKEQFSAALKWAYTPDREDCEGDDWNECPGFTVLWNWWRKPMTDVNNKAWKKILGVDGPLVTIEHQEKVQEYIEEEKQKLLTIYEAQRPDASQLNLMRGWVAYQLKKKEITMNPPLNDLTVAQLAEQYLKDIFYVVDENGTSIVWEAAQKLWIQRKKDRSAIALGEAMNNLMGNKIIFTDDELKEKWTKRIANTGAIGQVMNWLKGKTPVFPHPVKAKLDRDPWTFPLQNGKIADLKTLEIRDRVSSDLFTMTANFAWFTDKPDGEEYIMDSKLLEQYKTEEDEQERMFLLCKLCPNAMDFIQGPFQQADRRLYIMKILGLCLTTHCSRKGVWLYGDGKGLKSTVINAVIHVMGAFAIMLAKKVFFASGAESGHNTDLMRAEGKRLVVVDELERKDQLRESLYKQFTAHGMISAREIFGGQGEWKPMGTPLFITNTIVSLSFTDSAISDRLLPIRGMTKVFGANDDIVPPTFDKKNQQEWKDATDPATGIHWILKTPEKEAWSNKFLLPEEEGGHANEFGCFLVLCANWAWRNLQTHQGELPRPDQITEDYKIFVREAEQIGQFVDENCIVQGTNEKNPASTALKDVFTDYKKWCEEQGIKSQEMKLFKASLKQKNLLFQEKQEYVDKRSGRVYKRGNPVFRVKVILRSNLNFEIGEHLLLTNDEVQEIFT